MNDEEFTGLFDRVADLAGKRVYVEIGTSDPDADPGSLVDTTPLRMHVTLGPIEDATNEDYARGAIMLRLGPDSQTDRIYIDREWITRVEGHGGAVKIWLHDAFYVGLVG